MVVVFGVHFSTLVSENCLSLLSSWIFPPESTHSFRPKQHTGAFYTCAWIKRWIYIFFWERRKFDLLGSSNRKSSRLRRLRNYFQDIIFEIQWLVNEGLCLDPSSLVSEPHPWKICDFPSVWFRDYFFSSPYACEGIEGRFSSYRVIDSIHRIVYIGWYIIYARVDMA